MFDKDHLFWFCALAGTGMFLIQFLLYFVVGDLEDTDDSSSQNFKWLSKQALTGFLMMFGWTSLTCKNELDYSTLTSTIVATLIGALTMFITGLIFKLARSLKSSGTVFNIDDAIGKEGSIYQRIPKGGVGKVTISLQDFTHEINAISLGDEEIDSFRQVQIIKKVDEHTVQVVPTNR